MDGVVFPLIGILLARITIAEYKYKLDASFYSTEAYKMCAFIAGLAVIGALICAIRATIFVILS